MIIRIEKIVAGGAGLGRAADGRVVMVPGVLPGEMARVAVKRTYRQYLEAELREVLEPAPERRSPPCPYAARCGGCDLQHATYPGQLAIKQALFEELLTRHGLAPEVLPVLAPPLPSPLEFGYRQRIRLQVTDGRAGFFQARSRHLEPVSACLLARPEINRAWAALAAHPDWPLLVRAALSLELACNPEDGLVVVLLALARPARPAQRQAAHRLCLALPAIQGIGFHAEGHQAGPFISRDSGPNGCQTPDELLIHLPLPSEIAGRSLRLGVEPGGFSQVNEAQNRKLLALLLAWLQPHGQETAADLYCGMGNFSLPLALRVREVHGVDIQAAAIRRARENAVANRIDNCHFERLGAAAGAEALLRKGVSPEIVLLDPPRGGCREIIPLLGRLAPERIALISCDPATLVRDLAGLREQSYRCQSMQLVDMFPQTHHLETMSLLRKNA